MSYYRDNLEYSLAKRIPAMEKGFTIETDYGPIHIEVDQAAPIVEQVRLALQQELNACPARKS